MSNTDYNIIGIDAGIASSGIAVLNMGAAPYIAGMYTTCWASHEQDKQSANAERRQHRGERRLTRRKTMRLQDTRAVLRGALNVSQEELEKAIKTINPWHVRHAALDARVSNLEFAKAIFHIIKHRGFHSNRKSERVVESKDTKSKKQDAADEKIGMLKGVASNTAMLNEDPKIRTIGELIAVDPKFAERKRNAKGDYTKSVGRLELKAEVETLFKAQRTFHGDDCEWLSPEVEARLIEILMHRRPTFSGSQIEDMVGHCPFEPNEIRAPKASYTFERFTWLQTLNNLKVISTDAPPRSLTPQEKSLLKEWPFEKASLSFEQARKKLALTETQHFNLCDPTKEKAKLFEASAYHKMRKALSGRPECYRTQTEYLDQFALVLSLYKTDEDIRAALYERIPALQDDNDTVEAILELSFEKFGALSFTAMKKMLPFLKAGERYDEAKRKADYSDTPEFAPHDYLPPVTGEAITNPVVRRAINKVIKHLNAVLKRHGAVREIHLEVGSDISRNKKDRQAIMSAQRENKKAKKHAEKTCKKEGVANLDPENERDMFLLRLYNETNGHCLYSDTPLDIHRLGEIGYAEVDHILPHSRTFDNSQSNKILVLAKANQDKGNRTPFEYMGSDPDSERWLKFTSRVKAEKGLNPYKRRKLLNQHLPPLDGFIERNLNDTRYISRFLKSHIETHLLNDLDEPIKVICVSGQATAALRHAWGFKKVRHESDLHHAVDAAVVAACNRSTIQRLTLFNKRKELKGMRLENYMDPVTGEIIDQDGLTMLDKNFPGPYDEFRAEVMAHIAPNRREALAQLSGYKRYPERLESVKQLYVVRAKEEKFTGEVFKGTVYSVDERDPDKPVLYRKVRLTDLKKTDLDSIKDADNPREAPTVEAIKQRMAAQDFKAEKAFEEPFYKHNAEGKPTTTPVKSVKVAIVDKPAKRLPGKGMGAVLNAKGSTVRTDIYQIDGTYRAAPIYRHQLAGEMRSHYIRNPTKADPRSEVELPPDATPLFSLTPNCFVRAHHKNGMTYEGYYRNFDRNKRAILLLAHDQGSADKKQVVSLGTLVSLDVLHVGPLGDLYTAS